MPQAGLVRRDHGTLQVALQRIENTYATKPSARDQNAIRLLRASRSHLLVQRFDRLLDAHTLPIQLAQWHVAPLPAGIITQTPRRIGPACAPVPNTRRPRLSSNQDGNTKNGRFTPLACSAATQSSPLVVTATSPPSSRDSVSTTASSHSGPPRILLELWPTTTADRHFGANCRQPRSRSSSNSTPLWSARQRALAVTRAACTDTCSGTIAHHSASGTTSLPTMNMPIRACQPQLSLCVMTSLRQWRKGR